ncbi:MAG: hypothetical protein Q4C53_04005 [Clostridia bacterium]|nr:hypothetical protein [Clostridia bacterium]
MLYDANRERMEARAAGERALASLRAALRDLSSARNFGLWDMLGGGSFVTLFKQMKLNAAKRNMDQAKRDLYAFARELGDIRDCDLTVETGDFLTFADFFFDNFFVDWMVQDRIVRAGQQVEDAIRRVEYVMARL